MIQESFRITLPFCKDFAFIGIIGLTETKPDTTEVDFFDETLANIAPLSVSATRFHGGETWPVTVIEENLNASLLLQLSRYYMENGDTRFYDGGQDIFKDALSHTTHAEPTTLPLTFRHPSLPLASGS
jgi:hypothetical protein